MKRAFIYTLRQPNTNNIFYVGRAVNLEVRLYGHLTYNNYSSSPVHFYMKANRITPVIEQVEEVPYDDINELKQLELFWIEQFRQWGFNLLNVRGNLNSKQTKKDVESNEFQPYLTTNDVSKLLNVTRSTLYRWRKEDKIKSNKIGGSIRYKISELNRYSKLDKKIV